MTEQTVRTDSGEEILISELRAVTIDSDGNPRALTEQLSKGGGQEEE